MQFEKSDIELQLNRSVEEYRFRTGQKQDIKKLAITVWVALMVTIGSNKLDLIGAKALLLICTPTLMFWLTDAMMDSITVFIHKNITKLEELLSKGNYKIEDPLSIFLSSSYEKISIKTKIKTTLLSIVSREINLLFYIIQLLISVIFVKYFI